MNTVNNFIAQTNTLAAKPADLGQMLSNFTGYATDSGRARPEGGVCGALSARLNLATNVYKGTKTRELLHDLPSTPEAPVKFLGSLIEKSLRALVNLIHQISFPKDHELSREPTNGRADIVSQTLSTATREEMKQLSIPLVRAITTYTKELTDLIEKRGKETPVVETV